MRILLWHGYLLGGTGSNVYTRALAREWGRAGHDVVVFCQDPHPRDYDLGGAQVVRPDIGGLLPVFVLDRYEGLEAKLLQDFTREEREHYVHLNAAAVREHLPDVVGADDDRLGVRERSPPPRGQLLVAAHRVLELGAVRLDRVARTGRGGDRAAEQNVVREDEIGRQTLAQGRGVELDVALALGARQVREQTRVEPFVAVEHEDREDSADVGPDDHR